MNFGVVIYFSEATMLLSCNHCQNTYNVDDEVYYRQQGNVLCTQCHVPLSPPMQGAGGWDQPQQSWDQAQQSWDQPQQSWDQAQQSWDQPQQSWDQPQQSWEQPQQSWDQPQQSWDQPQQSWDQPQQSWDQPQQSWDQPQQSWDQPQQSWDQPQQSWDQPQQSWDQPQQSWDQPQQSWDQPQQSWDQPQQSWDQPQQSWDQPQQSWGQPKAAGVELDRTMALDIGEFANFDPKAILEEGQNAAHVDSAASASWGNDAWEQGGQAGGGAKGFEAWGDNDPWASSGAQPPAKPASSPANNAVIVGQSRENIHGNQTQYLDLAQLKLASSTKSSGIIEFFGRIPPLVRLVVGVVLALCIIGLTVVVIVNMVSAPKEKSSRVKEMQAQEVVQAPKSFKERVSAAKSRVPALPVIDGADVNSGALLAISPNIGVVYNDDVVFNYGQLRTDKPYIASLGELVKNDSENNFILLFDETVSMDIVYRVMYTVAAHSKELLLGGSTGTGISAIKIEPYNWPNFGDLQFPSYPNVEVKLTIERNSITLTKIAGSTPLLTSEDGTEPINEVTQEILGGKYIFTNLVQAFAKLKVSRTPYIIILPRANVSLGNFVTTLQFARGDVDNPNVEHLLVASVPLR
ncbi:MAG: hypothetical protein WC966_08700 [Bradymonadales bacterium]